MTTEQEIYELLEKVGEVLEGEFHIIPNDEPQCEGEGAFRVYHAQGYCFDVVKEISDEDEDVTYYSFLEQWDGFKNDLTAKGALKMLKKVFK